MKKLTTEQFIENANRVHSNTYRYLGEYQGTGIPITILCSKHGEFKQTPGAHVNLKQGCPKCAITRVSENNKLGIERFIERAKQLHGNNLDYSRVKYVHMHHKVEIICRKHGPFFQVPNSHLGGRSCPGCSVVKQQKRNIGRNNHIKLNFEKICREKHGMIFDYTETVYEHNQKEISFRCIIHDRILTQTARDHLDGYNPCTQCNHMKSYQEDALAKYATIFTPVVIHDRKVLRPKEIDILMPEVKLAIEYCGMYWHSHNSVEMENRDKNKHYLKYIDCEKAGIRLLTVFEAEWKERPKAIKRLIRNAVGKSKGKLMARKCELKHVVHGEAKAFYEKYHPQGGSGSGEHYGLYWKDKLVACMRFSLGANDRGSSAKSRVWTLGRYATRVNVAGGASRLFKAFVAEFNPDEIKSFSDNRYFSGGMYEQLGFELELEVAPDYQVWSPKLGLLPKPHYQRRMLAKRQAEHDVVVDFTTDDPRTERQVTYAMGARRIYDCGKKRWVWNRVVV